MNFILRSLIEDCGICNADIFGMMKVELAQNENTQDKYEDFSFLRCAEQLVV